MSLNVANHSLTLNRKASLVTYVPTHHLATLLVTYVLTPKHACNTIGHTLLGFAYNSSHTTASSVLYTVNEGRNVLQSVV